MNQPRKIIYEFDTEVDSNVNTALQKYFNTARYFLEFDPLALKDPSLFLKEIFKFYKYKLPAEINEYFFRLEEAPFIWVCESPLNKYLKDFYRHHFPVINGIDQYRPLKESFSKWLTNKFEDEKKYYALSITNFLDSYNSRTNFLSIIYAGIISSYDKILYNPSRSIELFNKSKEIITRIKLSDAAKKELEYLMNLFLGYSYLIQKENELAKLSFKDALKLNPTGITAKFHLALANMRLNNEEKAENIIKEIYNYDSERIDFALKNLSFSLFNFFIENAVYNNLFYYPEFASLADKIENFLSFIKISNEPAIRIIINKFEVFNIVIEEKNFPDEINKKIKFIGRTLKKYEESNNVHFLGTAHQIKANFLTSIQEIKEDIQKKFYKDFNKKMDEINEEIQSNSEIIDTLTDELEKRKLEFKNNLSVEILNLENKLSADIHKLENEIKELPLKPKLNPQHAFKQAMTYNVLLSFMVFLMGGCAGYSNNFVHSISELKDLIGISFVTGTKWGSIAFLIGVVLSVFSSAFTLLERSNKKQRLLFNISLLKNEKENGARLLKKEFEHKESVLAQNYTAQIDNYKEKIESLKRDIEKLEIGQKAEADKLIEEEFRPYAFIADEETT